MAIDSKVLLVPVAIVGGLLWAMAVDPIATAVRAVMQEPRPTPTVAAEEIDFLMHDMEVARQQAKDAYAEITGFRAKLRDADNRAIFDNRNLREHP